ncbi:unnamed protein product [Meganyctiphanes norvegica]|uniref:Uncharacterized protein n=1 Tax=Meganyctiphanes norvegica TaxID=48144 RepID=A0AAV2QTI0_MEGNR
MDKQSVLGLIAMVVLAIGVQVSTAKYMCYDCSDNPNNFFPYDPDCGKYDYNNLNFSVTGERENCLITIDYHGSINRGGTSGTEHEDGDCDYDGSSSTTCWCKGDYCNTDSYCSQCGYPKPTPTEAVTTSATTELPGSSLQCYNCIGCSSVEEGTTPVVEDGFLSCMTTVFLDSSQVIRGGNYEEHPDGECIGNSETFSCWCSQDLCNNDQIGS